SPAARIALARPGLDDPVRAVRLAAARTLATVDRAALTAEQQAARERGVAEVVAAELVNADRPEAHVNLAALYARLDRPADAEAALRAALRLDERFLPALLG